MNTRQGKLSGLLPALLAPVMMLAMTGTAQAVAFQTGDVFAAVSGGSVQHWRPGTGLLDTYSDGQGGFTTGMAFDSADNLYMTNFSAANISKFDTNGGYLGTWASNDTSSSNESILFDAGGNVYIGQADGTRDIIKRAADGTFLARYDVATERRGSDWIDLAADQKTMYYTSEGRRIMRYDVSTDTQLTDFATLPGTGTAFAFRLLGDGGLLVADYGNIKRLDSTGTVIQTYDAAGNNSFFSLNLDGDGISFWSGDISTGQLRKFDIASGILMDTINTGKGGSLFGVAVLGEITASGGGSGGGTVPEPATLLLFGVGLTGLAFSRRRKIS